LRFIGRLFAAALLTALVMLLVGGLFYLRPQLIADTRKQLNEQRALSAVVGVLANFVGLFLTGLLAITICLLPLALVPLLLLLAINVVGWAVASQVVGERVVKMTNQSVQPVLTILVGAFLLTGVSALLWSFGGCFQFIAKLFVFAVASLGAGAVLVPWLNRRRGNGGVSGEGGGGDVPPSGPTPVVPTPPAAESVEPYAQPDVVEHDVAAPVDYMTAEEINATAEQKPSQAPKARGRGARMAAAESTPAPEVATEESVEQDVAAPVDYVTAQEINTADVVTEGDDFLRIKGIGPTYARRLKDAGYATFAQLAAATPEEVAAAIGWPVDRVRRSEVIDQAKVLAQ
jgi:predicted flap endonuclease-1-like 5' DNA nuclease